MFTLMVCDAQSRNIHVSDLQTSTTASLTPKLRKGHTMHCCHIQALSTSLINHIMAGALRKTLANAANDAGETPLHKAAACSGASALKSITHLLAAGAEPDAVESCYRSTAAHVVLQSGGYQAARYIAACASWCICRLWFTG